MTNNWWNGKSDWPINIGRVSFWFTELCNLKTTLNGKFHLRFRCSALQEEAEAKRMSGWSLSSSSVPSYSKEKRFPPWKQLEPGSSYISSYNQAQVVQNYTLGSYLTVMDTKIYLGGSRKTITWVFALYLNLFFWQFRIWILYIHSTPLCPCSKLSHVIFFYKMHF